MIKMILAAVGLALSVLILITGHANAEARLDKGDNKVIYFNASGKKLTPLEANSSGEKGEVVLSCKQQDYICNERTGKCALKNAR